MKFTQGVPRETRTVGRTIEEMTEGDFVFVGLSRPKGLKGSRVRGACVSANHTNGEGVDERTGCAQVR